MSIAGQDRLDSPHPLAGPVGIGGWLILPLLDVVINPFYSAYEIHSVLTGWNLLGPFVGGAEDGRFEAARLPLLAYTFTSVVRVALAGYCLCLMLKRSPRAPRWMIIYYAVELVLGFLDFFLYRTVEDMLQQASSQDYWVLPFIAAICLIWIVYFRRSRRVANTFRSREEADRQLGEIFS
ncbi:DUF2569 domain-containing protein [Labrys sp. LIt4]|uniref:DUF2569 domain-containing protein n=1 Tax=Labrys sp. LIt4 TaxID=2821355 RepID=UPI001ADF5E43|nr:DUF2569 domain-containing protein [Labrys sp. LIt4]MBP0581596.1 DUF2569 domain-containing protein [Labrys sp. LIt4]